MTAEPMLRVAGAHKAFGRHQVLLGVDLQVPAGTIAAVLGPSGCGKTTLLRLIAGFEELDQGSISIAGIEVATGGRRSVPAERRRVGVVPQEGALFPHLDLAGNVGFGLARGRNDAARIEEMLEMVGLAGMGRKRPHQLSGGQQQRAALARALAPEPALVLMDEPFSSLDAGMRADVREEVFEVVRAAGATAVLVTHDQQEALSIADQVAVLLAGRVAQTGEPTELYSAPSSLEVATFVGEAVVLAGVAHGATASCVLGEVGLAAGSPSAGAVDLVIRPEQLVVGAAAAPHGATAESAGPAGAGGAGGAVGVVVGRSYYGHDGVVRVALPGGDIVTCRMAAGVLPARGAYLCVRANAAVVAFPARA